VDGSANRFFFFRFKGEKKNSAGFSTCFSMCLCDFGSGASEPESRRASCQEDLFPRYGAYFHKPGRAAVLRGRNVVRHPSIVAIALGNLIKRAVASRKSQQPCGGTKRPTSCLVESHWSAAKLIHKKSTSTSYVIKTGDVFPWRRHGSWTEVEDV
jgi:hypothetical protein